MDTVAKILNTPDNADKEMSNLVCKLLEVQLRNNFFDFGEDHLLQVKGLPMGKPWAPAVACLYLSSWDAILLNKLASPPLIYCRYIDDLFMVFPSRPAATTCLNIMNSINPNIKIGEALISTRVHFLDTCIEVHPAGTNVSVSTHIYRKPCDLRVILHMQSAHSYTVKVGTIISQMIRMWRICSDHFEACREISDFLQCMREFRGLQTRTMRKIINRFLAWVCNDLIGSVEHRCTPKSSRMTSHAKTTVCMWPSELNNQCVKRVTNYVTERLSDSELAHVGTIQCRNMTSARLCQLLT